MTSSPPQRILLIRNAAAFDYGGGERFPVHLARELEESGFSVTIVSGSDKLLKYAEVTGIPAIHGWWWARQDWAGVRALLFPIYVLWQLVLTGWYLQLLVRIKSDVVHPQSRDDFIAATLAAKLLSKRVIWTDHADLKYIFANHGIWYKNPVGKLVYFMSRFAHTVTLVSFSEAKLIEESLGHSLPANFVVIHNGVTETNVAPIDVETPKDAVVFCATSRLVIAKGIGELIEAFKLLRANHPEALLWLVGDGPDRDKFKEMVSKSSGITFFGHSEEPLRYVAASDIFVHPSYHEGFSISLVEAAMLAKPIIACNVGGNPEIISDNSTGILVPVMDPQALFAAMERLLKDTALRQKLGSAARDRFVHEFEFKTIVKERFIPLYE